MNQTNSTKTDFKKNEKAQAKETALKRGQDFKENLDGTSYVASENLKEKKKQRKRIRRNKK